MRMQIVLTLIFVLCTALAQGASAGYGDKASLDIIGSKVINTTFISPDGTPVEVDIVGSTTSNILVGTGGNPAKAHCRDCYTCGACGEKKIYITPWDDFKRPLCYPWSSYIPTRYNMPMINWNSGIGAGATGIGATGAGATGIGATGVGATGIGAGGPVYLGQGMGTV